jgi:mannose/fructose/N-acetylgalactosamine-specific phosphotransferase system component IIC
MAPWDGLIPVTDPSWLSFLILALVAGLLALDDTAFAQTWIGQPLPAAILTGYLCSDPLTGLAIGLPLQLVLAGNLPVGQTFTGDPTSATVAAVGGTVLSGTSLAPVPTGDPTGSWSLLGWVLLGAGLLSLLGHQLIQAERRSNGLMMMRGHISLRDGRLWRIEKLHLRCLLITFGRGFGSGFLFVIFILKVWLPLFEFLPAVVQAALGTLPLLLPGLGLGTMIDRYGFKSSWPWVGLGLVAMFLVARFAA